MADVRRRSNGTFLPGHPGGPGRPPRSGERAYLIAAAEECTLDDWRAIVRCAVKRAKSGDDKARSFLANTLLGSRPPSLAWVLAKDAGEAVPSQIGTSHTEGE